MSTRFIRMAVATLALAAPMAFSGSASASPPDGDPVSDVAVVVGGGVIEPGLPTTGCAVQSRITFSGTAVVVGDEADVYSVTFEGNSGTNCESLASGQGCGTLSGSGVVFARSFSGTVCYTRTGPIVILSGTGQIGGHTHSIEAGACVFVPTSVNPVTSYALECTVWLSS